jgi:hypothetical protein
LALLQRRRLLLLRGEAVVVLGSESRTAGTLLRRRRRALRLRPLVVRDLRVAEAGLVCEANFVPFVLHRNELKHDTTSTKKQKRRVVRVNHHTRTNIKK